MNSHLHFPTQQDTDAVVALRCFARQAGAAEPAVQQAASAPQATLRACLELLGPYTESFAGVATAAATSSGSRANLERCRELLSGSAAEEARLAVEVAAAQAGLQALGTEAAAVSRAGRACLELCLEAQGAHASVLGTLSSLAPAELSPEPSSVSPADSLEPLGLVLAFAPGGRSALEAALGVAPSDSPLSAGLLLQASSLDSRLLAALQQQAGVVAALAEGLGQYHAALSTQLGPQYPGTSLAARWLPALQALAGLPPRQGLRKALELAPAPPDDAATYATWRVLKATHSAAVSVLQSFAATRDGLRLERVDVALAAEESRARLASAVALGDLGLPDLAEAFAAFSSGAADELSALGRHAASGGGVEVGACCFFAARAVMQPCARHGRRLHRHATECLPPFFAPSSAACWTSCSAGFWATRAQQ